MCDCNEFSQSVKESIKTVATLTVICSVCAFLVATANELTRKPIADTGTRQKQDSILAVLPQYSDSFFEKKHIVIDGATNTYFETSSGYAMEVTAKGYAGEIKLMLGFAKNEEENEPKFWSYKVLAHSETPGLGAHIAGTFPDNVRERGAFSTNWKVSKDGGDIVPITAATISSRAVCDAISRASETMKLICQTK